MRLFFLFPMGLTSLLAAAALAAGYSLAKPSDAHAQALAEVQVTALDGITPIPNALTGLDLNNNGYVWTDEQGNPIYNFTSEDQVANRVLEYGDMESFTDDNGVAYFGGVVGIADTDRDGMPDWFELQFSDNATAMDPAADPDHDGRTNLEEYLSGTNPLVSDLGPAPNSFIAGVLRGIVNSSNPLMDFYARPDEKVSLEIVDVRGRRVAGASGVGDLSVDITSKLAAGKYFALLHSESGVASRPFVNLGGVQTIGAHRVSLEEAAAKGWIDDAAKAGANKLESMEGNVMVHKEGYEDAIEHVTVNEGWNEYAVQMTPLGRQVALKVFNISGSQQLVDGSVTFRRGDFVQTLSPDAEGVYRLIVPVGVDSLELSASGFVGHDGTPVSLLRTSRVAARGWVADELTPAPADSLEDAMNLYLVPESRMNDQQFTDAVGRVQHRWEDVKEKLYLTTAESGFATPANPLAVDRLRNGIYRIHAIYDGGSADGLPLLGYLLEELNAPDDESGGPGVHDIYVHNGVTPGNAVEDLDGDSYLDNAGSHIQESNNDGTAMDELLGPTVLYDNPNTIGGAYINDGTITPLGVDMIHTVMKSRLGRDYRD